MRVRPGRLLSVALVPLLGACGGTASSAYLRVPAAEPPAPDTRLGRLVGELLGSDAARSAAAERSLLALDGIALEWLAAHAAAIPGELDPRWLHVLDEQRLLPTLPPEQHVAFLLWKVQRPESFYVMKARAALTEQARRDPAPLVAALQAGLPGSDQAALALSLAGRRDAVPALLDRYVASEVEDERRTLAEALRGLLGEETRVRATAPRGERERRAAEIRAQFLLGTAPDEQAPPGGAGG